MPRKTTAKPKPTSEMSSDEAFDVEVDARKRDRAETLPEEGGPAEPEDDIVPNAHEDEESVGLDDTEEEDSLFAIWYGIQGTTKTTSMARVLRYRPEGKLLVCNAEAGLKARALRQHGVDTSRIEIWPKPGIRPTFDALERLVMRVDGEMAQARRDGAPKPYCAFGVDSGTELIKLMLDNLKDDSLERQRAIAKAAREKGARAPRRDPLARFKSERDDYQVVSQQMRNILRRLRYMDLDVLITALVRRDEDADTGRTMYGPAVPPALQLDLLGYADVVIRTERRASDDGKTNEIVGITLSDETNHGKDRYGVLPTEIPEPGADVILSLIHDPDFEAPVSAPSEFLENMANEGGAEEPTEGDESKDEATEGSDGPADGDMTITPELEKELQEVENRPKPTRTRRTRAKTAAKVGPESGTDDEPPY